MAWRFAALAVLLAGCAQPATLEARAPGVEGVADSAVRSESGRFELFTDLIVSDCVNGNEAGYYIRWEHIDLRREPGDTSVAVHVEWVANNPTNQWLRFRLTEQPQLGGPGLLEWNGASPQDVVLVGRELESYPERLFLQVSATGCPPEGPVGVHTAMHDRMEQPVDWSVDWNTMTDH